MAASEVNRTRTPAEAAPHTGTEPARRSAPLAGLPLAVFAAALAVVLAGALTDRLPPPMITGFAVVMVLGGLFVWIAELLPRLRDFGLPVILCTFAPAVLVFTGLVPQPAVEAVTGFTEAFGFLDFFVIALITGSVLGMPRTLLLKAGLRFTVPLLGCIVLTLLAIGGIGALSGFGFREALLHVAAPAMAGGLGIGALPMSEMYADRFGGDPGDYMAMLMSAVVLANTVCILIAGLYNGLGRNRQLFVGFNGHGQLLRVRADAPGLTLPKQRTAADFTALAQGLLLACLLLVAGTLLAAAVPRVHELAWAIVLAALLKAFGLLPRHLEDAAASWSDLAATAWLPALLVCVSITYIDIGDVVAALRDPAFLLLTTGTVVVSALVAGLLGWLVKMNFVEASITPGLAMADSGGSGDVAVLSAADRLHLMPFAQLSTRLGGVVTLLLVSLLVPLL